MILWRMYTPYLVDRTGWGWSIMKQENPGTFINYKSLHSAYHIPCDEINSLLRDRFNNIWLGSIGGGVLMIDTKQFSVCFLFFEFGRG